MDPVLTILDIYYSPVNLDSCWSLALDLYPRVESCYSNSAPPQEGLNVQYIKFQERNVSNVRECNLPNNFLGSCLPRSLFSILLRTRLPQSWHTAEVYCINLLLLSHRVIEKLKILSKNLSFAARCNFPPVLLCSQKELDLIQKAEIRSGDLRHTLL